MARAVGTNAALQRLTKWRAVFAGWQLGTRSDSDAEAKAVKDHREITILLRAEVSTLTGLLIEKGVFTAEELDAALGKEAELLSADYSRRFPGFVAEDYGMSVDPQLARQTTKGWKP